MFYQVPKISALLSAVAAVSGPFIDPVVNLSYASYRGVADENAGVTQWLGMRYAAPPLGELRFAAPQDPVNVSGIQDASKNAPYCLGVGVKPPFSNATSEDCLYLDVFAPSNATNTSSLPVYFFIQGGGFASDANANYNGRGLIQASQYSIVVVTHNYRVGPYGFISGSEIESPNNGLKDQRKAMEWVQRHISSFGGNPNHVVIGGDSAGAASVAYHLTAYGGRNDSLFHGGTAESVSFATELTVNQSQYLYNDLAMKAGCPTTGPSSLSCLRNLTTDQLQTSAAPYPYPGESMQPLFGWNPVIDGDMIRNYSYNSFNAGHFVHVPTIVGDDTNGGTIFVPRSTNTLNQSNNFLLDQFPYLTPSQLSTLDSLYPNQGPLFPKSGAFWRQASTVYGDMRYMCPGLFINTAMASHGVASYSYRYNVQDPAQESSGLGVPHTVELNAIWGPGNVGSSMVPQSYLPNNANAAVVPLIQAYWTSFVRTLDPNPYRERGARAWDVWEPGKWNRYLFDTPVKDSKMEEVSREQQGKCRYIWDIGVELKQ